MKKLIAVFLILSLVLAGCTAPDSDPATASSPDLQQGAPTEGTSSQTDPTDAQEGTRPGPVTSDPTSTNPSVPDSTENGTEGTTPAGPTEGTTPTEPKPTSPQASEKPTTPTTPSEETKPTTPPETKPTEPPATEPEATDPPATEPEKTNPPAAKEDASAIASQANSYAVSLGFVVDYSLNKGNSGYYSPDYRPIATNEVGIAAAKDLVSATKNQLNSRFSEGFSPTLVESIFGLVRVNCVVEYSHTDELGNWYYIYVFYG